MAETTRFYTEGGMPSNRQVAGVRNTRVYGDATNPVAVATLYDLFDLSADEVVVAMGIDVLTASGGGTASVTIDGVAIDVALTGVVLTAEGKISVPLASLPDHGDTGTVEITFTGATIVDVNVYAVVANVYSLETFTKVDTPAP